MIKPKRDKDRYWRVVLPAGRVLTFLNQKEAEDFLDETKVWLNDDKDHHPARSK